MKNYLKLFFCFILTNCVSTSNTRDMYTKFSNKIESQYIKHICKDKKFSLVMKGGRVTEKVQIVCLTFTTVATLDISAARKIFIEREEKFLEMLNESEEIKPYLYQIPSGPESLELHIAFKKSDGSFVSPPHIALVSVFRGRISYDIFEITNRSFNTVYSEPYEEGYKIVYGKEKE